MKALFISIIALVFIVGCATRQPLPEGLRTESQSAGGVKIVSVELMRDDSGLLVHGTVERSSSYFDNPFRHLDLEVRNAAGELLVERALKFFPNPIPHNRFGAGRATYTVRLSEVPPPGSVIRLKIDSTSFAECKLVKAEH